LAFEHGFHALRDAFDDGCDFATRIGRDRFELFSIEQRPAVALPFDALIEMLQLNQHSLRGRFDARLDRSHGSPGGSQHEIDAIDQVVRRRSVCVWG
jgi:hypothetical protein